MNEYYYEIGVMPTEDVEDGYSLYVKTEKELNGTELENLQYLVDEGLISNTDAKDSIYVQPCTKEDYGWSKGSTNNESYFKNEDLER